ncbi:MAG: NFACT family protein [Candidatus Aenigmatarchaeota archaeon]|nr:MAG: NFACT family protein [Candidatus Aenigmarchaeota archaeon]
MEKTEITSLDLKFLVKELRENLAGGMFRKIYQYGGKTKQFLFEIFVPAKGAFWLYVDNQKMFLTKRKKAIPQEPPSFCMFLRKHLMGKKILDAKQHDFDRIVEISTKESVLIFELLSPGNVILCDTSYKVIMSLQVQRWRDREIKPKGPYKYPPKPSNPFELDLDSLKRSLAIAEKKTIAYLAKNLGFGSVYASEICSRAKIDEGNLTSDLSFNEILKLHEVIVSIESEKPNPGVYDETVSPFPLEIFKERESKPFGSFSEALDEFFSGQEIETVKKEVKKTVEGKKEKVERIVERQEEALEKWESIEKDSRECAERIYNNYTIVEGVLNGIRKAKDSGLSWGEIKQRIKSEGTPEAEAIKEIRENDGVVILDLGGKDVLIDIRKTPEENAQKYYEDAKWAKRKFGGTEEAKGEHEEKLERAEKEVLEQDQRDFRKEVFPVEKRGMEEESKETEWEETVLETPLEAPLEDKPKRKRKKWFEKFKWFRSSQGFLVVAGRNASQNEMLIKKHTEGNDLVFHADIPGAAFVIIKSEGHDIPEETKKEAAEFAAANSKAWARGMGNVDIFSVNPDQVSKTPPSGQYLPKGSFMIHGERVWYRDMELKLSVGVKIDREERVAKVMAGPVMSIRKNSDYFVTVRPGFKKSMELAKNIKSKILIKARPEDKSLIEQIPLDEFQVAIPSGMGDVMEYVGRDYI